MARKIGTATTASPVMNPERVGVVELQAPGLEETEPDEDPGEEPCPPRDRVEEAAAEDNREDQHREPEAADEERAGAGVAEGALDEREGEAPACGEEQEHEVRARGGAWLGAGLEGRGGGGHRGLTDRRAG